MMRSIKILAFFAGLASAVAQAADVSVPLREGQAQLQSGQYEDAQKTLRSVTEQAPDNGEAWRLLGRTEMFLGNYDAALEDFTKAKDKGVNVNADVGAAQYHSGDNAKALETLATVVSDDAADADAHYLYGLALFKAERFKSAREHLAKARELDPDLEAESLVFSAAAAGKMGDGDTARKELETAAAADPDSEAGKAAKKALDNMKGLADGSFQGAVQLSTQYDSNVLLVPESGGLFTPGEISNKSGSRLVFNGQAAWTPALGGDWRGQLGYGLYQSLHYTHRDTVKGFDLTNHGVTLGADRKTANATLSIPYNLALAFLNTFDNNTRYSITHSVAPAYVMKFGAHSVGLADTLGYEDFAVDPKAITLDGEVIEQSRDNLFDQLTAFYRLEIGRAAYLTPSAGFFFAAASGDNSWDHAGGRAALQCGVALTKTLGLDAGLSYTARSYGNPFAVQAASGAVTAEDRSDGEGAGNLGLTYVRGHFNALAGLSYTRNASTIDIFQFRRTLLTLGAGAQF